jgi:hypothetical protein
MQINACLAILGLAGTRPAMTGDNQWQLYQ